MKLDDAGGRIVRIQDPTPGILLRGQAFVLLQQIARNQACFKCGMPATCEVVGWAEFRCDTHQPGQHDPANQGQLKPGCESYGGDIKEMPCARIVRDLLSVAFPDGVPA